MVIKSSALVGKVLYLNNNHARDEQYKKRLVKYLLFVLGTRRDAKKTLCSECVGSEHSAYSNACALKT
jgi:hypothetical protein